MRTAIAVLLLAVSCRADESTPETASAQDVPSDSPTTDTAAIDARDQYALLATIEATIGDALTRDAGAMASVRADWEGRRYRWEVAFVPQLCGSADACHVRPFDHGRLGGRRIQQGWMPQLELDAAGLAAIGQRCAGHRVCVLDLEATLREFVFDPELATALRFSDVAIHGARDATATESWMRSSAPVRGRT
jgi:hypothetical protein